MIRTLTTTAALDDLCWKWRGLYVDIVFGVRGWVLYTPVAVPGARPTETGRFEREFGFVVTRAAVEHFAKENLS